MSAKADVTFPWGDGKDYRFALRVGELEELQEKTGAGPEELLHRLTLLSDADGGVKVSVHAGITKPGARDLIEIHRLGLIGGGTPPSQASVLVNRYVAARPRAESYLSARMILMAAVFGVPDDPVGKPPAETEALNPAA